MAQISQTLLLLILFSGALASGEEITSPRPPGAWENITLPFFADAVNKPAASGPATAGMHGLFVNPKTSEVFVNYSPWNLKMALKELHLYVSKDHGDAWIAIVESPISGRGQTGFWCNMPQPFDGRMVLWTIDGTSASTADGGAAWKRIGKQGRGFDFGDIDWNTPQPRTLFALEHEPFYRVLSTNGGETWRRLDEAADQQSFARDKNWYPRLGVVNATTLLQTDGVSDGILLRSDLGATWGKVSDFHPLGAHPIHFKNKLYWAATAGVIVSKDGKDWQLLGAPLPNATWGPLFGVTDQELLVVNEKGVQLSLDGAKTWTQVAPPPPGVWLGDSRTLGVSFAWDDVNRIVYAAHAGLGCFRLHLPLNHTLRVGDSS